MGYISFPGLGIEPFHIDKTAFTLFGRGVAWYGILITIGMVLAVAIAFYVAKRDNISSDDVIDLALWSIIFGVLGSRVYYVIFTWNEFDYLVTSAVSDGTFSGAIGAFFSNAWATFVNCIAIWNGGMAIYGGVIAGMIVGVIFARVKKIHFLQIFDILAPAVMIGQIIGRWGNFVNMEAHGGETSLPWRMGLLYGNPASGTWISEQYVHPTFFYESVWNLIGLVLIISLVRRKKFKGQSCAIYFTWYGFGRMLIESLRTDSLYIGPFRVSQLVGLVSLVAGVLMLILLPRVKSLRYDTPAVASAEDTEANDGAVKSEDVTDEDEKVNEKTNNSDKEENEV